MPASDNLQAYSASAIPSKMLRHWPDPQTRRQLIDTLEPIQIPRALSQVGMLASQAIAELAQRYPLPNLPLNIPDADYDKFDFLNIPGANSRGNFAVTQVEIAKTQEDVSEWVETIVLATVQRVLHIFDTLNTERWHVSRTYVSPEEKSPAEAISSILYRRYGRYLEPKPQVHVLTFAPWDVTYGDICDFAQTMEFSQLISPNAKLPPTTRNDKMWFHVFDRCIAAKTRWFVLTNADTWCFGVFANGWKTAFVMAPLPHNSRFPTIVQMLILWASSSREENQDVHGVSLTHLENFVDGSNTLVEEFIYNDTSTEPDEEQTRSDLDVQKILLGSEGPHPSDSYLPLEILRDRGGLQIQDSHDERAMRLGINVHSDQNPFKPNKRLNKEQLQVLFKQYEQQQRQQAPMTRPLIPANQGSDKLSQPRRMHLFRQNAPLVRHYSEPGISNSRLLSQSWNTAYPPIMHPGGTIIVPIPEHPIDSHNIDFTTSVDGQTLANHSYSTTPVSPVLPMPETGAEVQR